MNKKLMAVAVAGALGAPALAMAQASTVQIYGKTVIEYGYANQGTGKPNIDMMQAPGGVSIGFKGTEALGGGLSAWFQCESSADPRGDTAAGFCTRNSAIGMRGGFGSVYIGKWDTPYKRVMLRGEVGVEDTGLFGIADYLSGGSTGAVAGNVAVLGGGPARTLWQRRQHDSINYDTPDFSGFKGHFAYSSSNATLATNGHTSAKPRVWSVAALYDNGPLSLGLAYERHSQFAPIAQVGGGDDKAWALSGSYVFMGKVKVGGSYNRQDYEMGPGMSVQKKGWALGVDWNVSGPHNLFANYATSGDTQGTAGMTPGLSGATGVIPAAGPNTGVKKWGVGYQHKFSKRTDGKLGYVRLDNDSAANYNLMGMTNGGVATRVGHSQDAFVMLLRHTF